MFWIETKHNILQIIHKKENVETIIVFLAGMVVRDLVSYVKPTNAEECRRYTMQTQLTIYGT